jgi:hypothetical protein
MSDRRSKLERRENKERRRARDRKRNANKRYAVIELSGATLHVVFLDRTPDDAADRVRALSHTWRHEATTLNNEKGLEELTAALRELSEAHNLQTAHLQFVLGGEYCVTKAVQGSNDHVANELQQLENRSRLYLMLGPGKKVTVSETQPLDARHDYAVAAVCNKKTLETIHNAAVRAGMQIDSIEPALISTSRVIGRLEDVPAEPCLLVHLGDSSVELGICHEGRLLLDYRPGGRTNPEELVELVCTHLNRLQRHVGRQLREAPPALNRVYLCGNESLVEKAHRAFSTRRQFEVEKIVPEAIQATWELVDGAEDSGTVAALGALLSTYLPKSERTAPNFMEHILASTREPLRPILLRSAMPLAAVLLVALSIFFVNYREQTKIDAIQEQLTVLATAQSRARELRLKLDASRTKLEQLTVLADNVQESPAERIVTRIGHCMPSDVWLTNMSIDRMETVQLAGTSYLEAGVFDFVNWLEQAPGFDEVALRSTQPGQSASGPIINFNIELSFNEFDEPVKKVARHE